MTSTSLSAGTIEYEDTGGDGPAIVLLPGLLMDSSLYADVVPALAAAGCRCVVPTLPLGAHRHAMAPDADLSLRGIARLVGELLERLDLDDVTLVGNDTGGALVQLLVTDDDCAEPAARVGRIVLVSCEAFDNLPPGLTGKAIVLAGHLPPALFGLFLQQLRVKAMRHLPFAFGWLTKRGDATTRHWLDPVLSNPAIRRDATRVLRGIRRDRRVLVDAASRLPTFDRPALVVWAAEDRVMPPDHGERLARLLPDARLVTIDDTYTLIGLDQPAALAAAITEFVAAGASAPAAHEGHQQQTAT
jgi:pimeloyl-ACP methyl ester carboxylesterase